MLQQHVEDHKHQYNDGLDEKMRKVAVIESIRKKKLLEIEKKNQKLRERAAKIESAVQLTQCFEDGHFMNVKTTDAKKLPLLETELFGTVVEDESNASSNEGSFGYTRKSNDFRSSKISRGFTGNFSEMMRQNTESKQGEEKDEEKKEDNGEIYKIEKEYTQKQDITDCFMPLRKFLECTYGVCYREKAKDIPEEEEKKWKARLKKLKKNSKSKEKDGKQKEKAKKSEKAAKVAKVAEDEEDQNEFFMRGKAYKEKYNGLKLSKIDYENKYSSLSEKIKINFPGMTIGDDGQLIPTKKFMRNKFMKEKELKELVKEHKGILKGEQGKKERKKTTFASALDLVQEMEGVRTRVKLPKIHDHVGAAREILANQVPILKMK
jgi:hypothetical protein